MNDDNYWWSSLTEDNVWKEIINIYVTMRKTVKNLSVTVKLPNFVTGSQHYDTQNCEHIEYARDSSDQSWNINKILKILEVY